MVSMTSCVGLLRSRLGSAASGPPLAMAMMARIVRREMLAFSRWMIERTRRSRSAERSSSDCRRRANAEKLSGEPNLMLLVASIAWNSSM